MLQYKLNLESEFDSFFDSTLSKIKAPAQIELIGELGAGKTTLVRNFCNKIGIKESVSSPTYVLQHEYKSSDLKIEHWDLYRVSELPEELFYSPEKNTIRFIEWADKFSELRATTGFIINISLLAKEVDLRDVKVSFL